MSGSDWAMQFLADILGTRVDRPAVLETTAMGAAWLAGQRAGICPDMEDFAAAWRADAQFAPAMAEDRREARYAAWRRAVEATIHFAG